MGKLKSISEIGIFFFLILLVISCKNSEFIVIKHKGEIAKGIYFNKFYKIINKGTLVYLFGSDTIKLNNIDIPLELKKNLLKSSKSCADVILNLKTKTTTVGNLFLIYHPFKKSLNSFSNKIVNNLKKNKISNVEVNWSEDIARTDTLFPLVLFPPTNFIKNSKINAISYKLINGKDSFSVIECHLQAKKINDILQVIYCINLAKSIKNLEYPKFLEKEFRSLIYSWVATIDTSMSNNEINTQKVNNLFFYADSIFKINGIKAAYDSLGLLDNFYTQNNDFQSKSYYYQVMMTLSSFCTDNLLSLKFDSQAHPRYNNKTVILSKNTLKFIAEEYIADKFGNEPVIMINEAHNRGQNRDFARKLLPKLYEKGFRYLAVEALDKTKDSLINKRSFPILSSGYYLKESSFGQFIRDAINLGFKLIAYEDTSVYNPNISYIDGQNIREIGQTKNLESIFKNDKNAKILVYAGYGHIEKKTNDKWIKMAEQLCKILDRNIPSIDCVLMEEGFEKKDENEYYRAVIDSFRFSKPIVLTENDTPFVHPNLKGKVDFNVFMPRTNYDLGYPDWLKETDDTYYTLKIPKNCDDAYLQVYKINEWKEVKKEAIPVMQFTLQKDRPEYKLYLRKGEYKVFISKNNRNIVDDYFTVN